MKPLHAHCTKSVPRFTGANPISLPLLYITADTLFYLLLRLGDRRTQTGLRRHPYRSIRKSDNPRATVTACDNMRRDSSQNGKTPLFTQFRWPLSFSLKRALLGSGTDHRVFWHRERQRHREDVRRVVDFLNRLPVGIFHSTLGYRIVDRLVPRNQEFN